MTITEFLLARIAEDETAARKASHQKVAGPFHGDWRSDSAAMMSAPLFDEADRKHIARHDPARVLAECEAKRRIVEDFAVLNADYRATHAVETEARRFQALVSIGQLATAYADHPDYDEAWRP